MTQAAAAGTSLSLAVGLSSSELLPPNMPGSPWWQQAAGILWQQVPDVVDAFCRCSAHKVGPGPHKLVLQIYIVDVLLKMQPDPVQRPGEEIMLFSFGNTAGLAASHSLYSQELPPAHQQPERPTFIKDVSVAPGPMLCYHSSSYLQCLSCCYCLLRSMYCMCYT